MGSRGGRARSQSESAEAYGGGVLGLAGAVRAGWSRRGRRLGLRKCTENAPSPAPKCICFPPGVCCCGKGSVTHGENTLSCSLRPLFAGWCKVYLPSQRALGFVDGAAVEALLEERGLCALHDQRSAIQTAGVSLVRCLHLKISSFPSCLAVESQLWAC